MNALAEELNRTLEGSCAGRLLSEVGTRMYYPKGILTQSAEAGERAKRFNATIGMAFSKGQPMALDAVKDHLPGLTNREAVAYAPTAGVLATREAWRVELLRKNPSLAGAGFSLPVVVPGLTAGISYLADMFVNDGDPIVVADMYWPNYKLIMEVRKSARLVPYTFFSEAGGFNIADFSRAVAEAARQNGKAVVILNYPNNPTGYTPTLEEAEAIKKALVSVAEGGADLLVISDDAYFGLQYEEGTLRESIFTRFASAHPRILAAKVDGQTKEDYVWGFRGGFITFASQGMTEAGYDALVKKLLGVIRSSVSNSAAPTQNILAKAMADPRYLPQKREYSAMLERRYRKVKEFLATHEAPTGLKALPFNSGYFMCFECSGYTAEELRLKLLNERGIGVIAIQDTWLRVAFSSVDEENLDQLYSEIYETARSMGTV
ncbi:MAG: aminotransferase class I/II-fold pyridoxal phosphate-dependent enzyme [Spirochaetales bacterium]|nr:aminotransferase class I/II-fold pyridoxal phosphate-dependent enzyme [Spirochaetales bacterium]